MNERPGLSFDDFQRWHRPIEVGAVVAVVILNAAFNALVSQTDYPDVDAWKPWVWEFSSAILILALIPFVIALERRWPFRVDTWRHSLPRHLLATIPFSFIHVTGMVALRRLCYALVGSHDAFGAHYGYEYLKDIRTYFVIIAVLCLWRLWLLRWQGEARLLGTPDEGQPAEPVDRPERFLVRKLGREFLLNASDVQWLQASGNYVNLHVQGRDYPLRSTMAAIEERLDPARFVRVHRGYFVNLDYLAQIESLDTGDARLTLRDGTTIPCSRRHRAALRERFGS